MSDPSTLTFALTYTGTLAVALLLFLGQFAALVALLALATTFRLLVYAVRAMTGLRAASLAPHGRHFAVPESRR